MGLPKLENCNIAVLGLGYVGLPLAIEFARKFAAPNVSSSDHGKIIGYDIDRTRIKDLINNFDKTEEITEEMFKGLNIEFTNDQENLIESDVFIVTVPTPIDDNKKPDIKFLIEACKTIGLILKKRKNNKDTCPVIIFESTVYPGLTEEVCVKELERASGLKYNQLSNDGFVCGYSPERINPGDKNHKLTNIIKITSGSNKKAADWIDLFYKSIINAGTYKCASIKEAEAAKVIENTQRDINIALINELAIIFSKMDINTNNVLKAASTKWNFINFKPGLVGGHCIGVDPFYLTYKSEKCGYVPEMVLAGRKINDSMGKWALDQLVMAMAKKSLIIGGSSLLILGFTFKEDCKDIRNTQVISLYKRAKEYNMNIDIYDPICDASESKVHYGLDIKNTLTFSNKYDALILAVAHKQFKSWSPDKWLSLVKESGIIYDLKNLVPTEIKGVMRL